ncbi:hypothetical protein MKX01_027011 [Papaver californicum]|nr:hypothetical protein MKX01_027011 [Papaver californicum]
MKRILKPASGNGSLVFKQNTKITQLGKSGRIQEAIQLFENMSNKNTVSWNSMISVYAKNGKINEARRLFDEMPQKNLVTWNTMISGYSHNDQVHEASALFEKMPQRDYFSWTLMITCYTRNGKLDKAKYLFDMLPDKQDPNELMDLGLKFFLQMEDKDVVSWNLMVHGFVQIGDLESASLYFSRIPNPNVVSWVTLLSGYAKNETRTIDICEALTLLTLHARSKDFVPDIELFQLDHGVGNVAAIASMCVQPEVTHRPFMGGVVQALKLMPDYSPSPEGRCVLSLSASDVFSSSRIGRQESGSFRRYSGSGPLRTGSSRQFWECVQELSRGTVGEHGVAFRL